jgi:hypothetical protein
MAAPYLANLDPYDGQCQVYTDDTIILQILDADGNLDDSSVILTVSGTIAWTGDAQQPGFTVTKTPVANGNEYEITPDTRFTPSTDIDVRVQAADLALETLDQTYSFTTAYTYLISYNPLYHTTKGCSISCFDGKEWRSDPWWSSVHTDGGADANQLQVIDKDNWVYACDGYGGANKIHGAVCLNGTVYEFVNDGNFHPFGGWMVPDKSFVIFVGMDNVAGQGKIWKWTPDTGLVEKRTGLNNWYPANHDAKVWCTDKNDIWAAWTDGIWRSTDLGETWSNADGPYFAVGIDGLAANDFYMCKYDDGYGGRTLVYHWDGVSFSPAPGQPLPQLYSRNWHYTRDIYVADANNIFIIYGTDRSWQYHLYHFDGVGIWTDLGYIGWRPYRMAGVGTKDIRAAKDAILRYDGASLFSEGPGFLSQENTPAQLDIDVYPYLENLNPYDGEVNVSSSTSVYLEIVDDLYGIDASSVVLTVGGVTAWTGDAQQPGFTVNKTVISANRYSYDITPDAGFSYDSVITIGVYAENTVSYQLNTTYSFETESISIGTLEARLLSKDVLRVNFSEGISVDENLTNLSNWIISALPSGESPTVKQIMFDPEFDTVSFVNLEISKTTTGVIYEISASNLLNVEGAKFANPNLIPTVSTKFLSRSTKIDAVLSRIPKMYGRDLYSNIRNILSAIALEDEEIGGEDLSVLRTPE